MSEISVDYNTWQSRAPQPAMREEKVAKIVDDAIEADDESGNQNLETYGEIAYRALSAAGALRDQPKVTRGELVDCLCRTTNLFTNDIEEAVNAILTRWPHIVGE